MYAAGTKVQQMDSAALARYASGNLGDLLANESTVHVKSYGLGSLATTSFRGGSANHTAILWNGIPVGSPMNGQTDLALLPVGAVDAIRVQSGGGTALWGSGALGGAVLLDNVARFGHGLQVDGGASFGSFGQGYRHVRSELSMSRWSTGITLFGASARNDFPFASGSADAPVEQRQANAAFNQYGLLLEQHLRLGVADRLSLHYWHQRTDRQVPPTLAQPASTAYQLDGGDRLVAEWRHSRNRWSSSLRGAWLGEALAWHSAEGDPAALSRSETLVAEGEMRWRPGGPHTLDLGLNFTRSAARSDGYAEGASQGRQALFALYRFQPRKSRLTGTAALRQEWQAGLLVPFTASLGAEYRATPWATLKAQAARLYRLPTFNDLYWLPGGDPALRPEQGYSGDAGVAFQHRWAAVELRGEITWFNRLVDNWIIWLPGPQWWSPSNIMQVWSRGGESGARIAWKLGRTTLISGFGTSYVVSTNQQAKSLFDESVGKQLIYVPMYSGHANIGVQRTRMSFTLSCTYSGYRYTSTDNAEFLPPYWLVNAHASWKVVNGKRWQADCFARAENLLAEQYQVVLNRPMPLLSFRAGVNIHFHRPNDTDNNTP